MVNETELFYLVMLILLTLIILLVLSATGPRRELDLLLLNPIATKLQRQRQTKRRSRRFLFQSKFGYPYQQICQAVSREHYPSIGNPSRANNVAHEARSCLRECNILVPSPFGNGVNDIQSIGTR